MAKIAIARKPVVYLAVARALEFPFLRANSQFREKAIGNTFRENSASLAVQRSALPSVGSTILPDRESL